ncbi:hypothetical protein BST61_g4066 [Cercospora zeina]
MSAEDSLLSPHAMHTTLHGHARKAYAPPLPCARPVEQADAGPATWPSLLVVIDDSVADQTPIVPAHQVAQASFVRTSGATLPIPHIRILLSLRSSRACGIAKRACRQAKTDSFINHHCDELSRPGLAAPQKGTSKPSRPHAKAAHAVADSWSSIKVARSFPPRVHASHHTHDLIIDFASRLCDVTDWLNTLTPASLHDTHTHTQVRYCTVL